MITFSNDIDILKYEPALFGFLHVPWQILCSGEQCSLVGTSFTNEEADFLSVNVTAGRVIYLRGTGGVPEGPYEIVSVESSSELCVSVLRSDSGASPIAPPSGQNLCWRMATFEPQAAEVGLQLTAYFGLRPGEPKSDYDAGDILDPEVLRQASIYAVIASAYAMLAAGSNSEELWSRNLHYTKLFTRARERIKFSIESGIDGLSDIIRIGGSSRLVRQ